MKHLRNFTAYALAGSIAMAAAAASVVASAQGFEPKKPVDFVIMAGKGGGADKMARLMQSIIEKYGLSSKPLVPINKPGGSGAEAAIVIVGRTGSVRDNNALAWYSWMSMVGTLPS